jgi:hypothetical protein
MLQITIEFQITMNQQTYFNFKCLLRLFLVKLIEEILFALVETMCSIMLETINVNDILYYKSSELEKYQPDCYVNARKTKNRNIIVTLKIPDTEYIFVCEKKTCPNNVWSVSTAKSKIAKLLISKGWFDSFLKNRQDKQIIKTTSNATPFPSNEINDDVIEPVPPVLSLNENEKFRDLDGNILEIMTCGERHEDRIYFDMTDVAKAFEMPNLRITLINKNSAYTQGQDYTVFCVMKQGVTNYYTNNETLNEISKENKIKTVNKRTFLTLSGLIRVLHVSRNKNAVHYCKWITHIIYTHQFGTQDQKEELTAGRIIKMDS